MAREYSPAPRPTSLWNPTFISLCIVSLFQQMGQMMMITIMPFYAQSLGAPATIVGLVVGAFAISALISRPFLAPAFDSFPKKPFMYVGLSLIAITCLLYGFTDSIEGLIATRMLHGLALGCTSTATLSLVTESVPLNKTASGISFFSLMQALSQAVGPALGLFLIDTIGFRWTYWSCAFSILVALGVFTLVKERPRENRPRYKLTFDRMFAKEALVPALLMMIATCANTSIMSFVALFATQQGIEGIGMFFTVQACCLLATRPIFGKLADKFGYVTVLLPALVVYGFAFWIISQATMLWMFLVAAVICACGYGVCQPLMQALAMASVPRARSGAASSTNYTGADCALLIGPILAGNLVETYTAQTGSAVDGYRCMYQTFIGVVILALIVVLIVRKYLARNLAKAREINLEEHL